MPTPTLANSTALAKVLSKAVIAGTALSGVAIAASQVYAAPVSYDFTVKVTQGALAGQSFRGAFTYDDASLRKTDIEELGVAQGLTVCMNYLGRTYTATDDSNYPAWPKLILEDGNIKQLDFWIQPNQRVNWWNLPGWEVKLSKRATAASCHQR